MSPPKEVVPVEKADGVAVGHCGGGMLPNVAVFDLADSAVGVASAKDGGAGRLPTVSAGFEGVKVSMRDSGLLELPDRDCRNSLERSIALPYCSRGTNLLSRKR